MPAQTWSLTDDHILDIGDEGEHVASVSLEMHAGVVNVLTHDEDTATVEVHNVENEPVEIAWTGRSLTITQKNERHFGFLSRARRASADVTITVPRDAELSLQTVTADVLASDREARVSIQTVNGTVTVRRLTGPLRVENVNGTVTGADLDGDVELTSVNGRTTLTSVSSPSIRLECVNGSMTVGYDRVEAGYTLATEGVNARVAVHLPQVPVSVESSSVNGRVSLDGVPRPRKSRSFIETGSLLTIRSNSVNGGLDIVREELPA